MSDYKITKISDNEYKVEKEIDWSSDDLEGFSKCVVCGKEFYPISENDRCCSLDCMHKYEANEEYYDKKRESDSLADSLCVLALLAFLIWCIVDFVKLVKAKDSWMYSNRECFYEQESEGCDSSRFLQDVQVHTCNIRCALNLSTQLQFSGIQESQRI